MASSDTARCAECATLLHRKKDGTIRERCRNCPYNYQCRCRWCDESDFNPDPVCCGWAHYPCETCVFPMGRSWDYDKKWGGGRRVPFWGEEDARKKRRALLCCAVVVAANVSGGPAVHGRVDVGA